MTKQRVHVVPKRRTRPAKSKLQLTNLPNSAVDRACSGQYPSTLLTMREAAEYLRFTGKRGADACRDFLKDHGVKLLSRGRDYVVRQSEIDQLLETGKGSLDVIAEQTSAQLLRSAAGGPR